MILALGRHMQVLCETAESRAVREENPRKRKRYVLSCTCRGHRQKNGHCQHTLAIFQEHIRPTFWPYITPESIMPSKNGATGKQVRSRVELERELVALRRRVRELEAAA